MGGEVHFMGGEVHIWVVRYTLGVMRSLDGW